MAYVAALQNCGVNSRYDCGEKTQAGRYVINICEFYWNEVIQISSRIGTIVHESSHHFGTTDEGYCDMVDCLALSSREARNNADTYTKLVEQLVSDRSLPGGSPSAHLPSGGFPQERRICPENSQTSGSYCRCATGYGCSQTGRSLDCPMKVDRYGGKWFEVQCTTCKCYPVQMRQPAWPR